MASRLRSRAWSKSNSSGYLAAHPTGRRYSRIEPRVSDPAPLPGKHLVTICSLRQRSLDDPDPPLRAETVPLVRAVGGAPNGVLCAPRLLMAVPATPSASPVGFGCSRGARDPGVGHPSICVCAAGAGQLGRRGQLCRCLRSRSGDPPWRSQPGRGARRCGPASWPRPARPAADGVACGSRQP